MSLKVFKNLPEILIQQIIEFARGEDYPFMYMYCHKRKMLTTKVKPYFMWKTLTYKWRHPPEFMRIHNVLYVTIIPPKIEKYRWIIIYGQYGQELYTVGDLSANLLEVNKKYKRMMLELKAPFSVGDCRVVFELSRTYIF